MSSETEVTRILNALDRDDPQVANELLPLVYDELRRLAAMKMANEPSEHTLQSTALVHEAYLRLVGSDSGQSWDNRHHFFAAAAEAMRRILIESARRKQRLKRGVNPERVPLEDLNLAMEADSENLLLVNDALERFQKEDPQKATLVKLRFFVGLKNHEAAEAMGISPTTAKRYWAFARAWLYNELSD